MSGVKTPFAIKNGKVIHVSELSKIEKGIDDEYYCCSCNEKLIPKLGSKNRWHFAHKSSNCTKSIETGLHLIAKKILSEHKLMMLPKLSIFNNDDFFDRKDFLYYFLSDRFNNKEDILIHDENSNHEFLTFEYEEEVICKSQLYSFDVVQVEKKLKDFIPDIILYKNNKPLLVEIAVTHFIDDLKLTKIKEEKLSTIEIDLSKYKKDFLNLSYHDIEKILIMEVENKKWIYNDKAENAILDLITKNKERKIREQKALLVQRKELFSKRERIKINQIYIRNNYIILKDQYSKNKKHSKLWKLLVKKLWIDESNIPDIINVSVDGDIVFACDKNIWQASIFYKFINNRKNTYLSARAISHWIVHSSYIPLNRDLLKNSCLIDSYDQLKLETVIDSYLRFLCTKGVIYFDSRSYRVKIDSFRAAVNYSSS